MGRRRHLVIAAGRSSGAARQGGAHQRRSRSRPGGRDRIPAAGATCAPASSRAGGCRQGHRRPYASTETRTARSGRMSQGPESPRVTPAAAVAPARRSRGTGGPSLRAMLDPLTAYRLAGHDPSPQPTAYVADTLLVRGDDPRTLEALRAGRRRGRLRAGAGTRRRARTSSCSPSAPTDRRAARASCVGSGPAGSALRPPRRTPRCTSRSTSGACSRPTAPRSGDRTGRASATWGSSTTATALSPYTNSHPYTNSSPLHEQSPVHELAPATRTATG